MRKYLFLIVWSIIGVGIISSLTSCSEEKVLDDVPVEPERSPKNGEVIVILFELRWDDVARECEIHLGPAGYGAVQVSSPLENAVVENFSAGNGAAIDRPWWERYQPVSYTFDNRSGDRDAFINMVGRCRAAGVDIYVDTIINHMTGVYAGIGTAGSTFSDYSYPGIYDYEDFHHCGHTIEDDIEDWEDPDQVQNCELVNLADLDTGSPTVRTRISNYLKDLLEIGVRGFRIDAARHMSPDDIEAILVEAGGEPYVYQEVIDYSPSQKWAKEYIRTGQINEFRYGGWLKDVFRSGSLTQLGPDANFWDELNTPGSDSVVVFLDNHDTQRHDALSFKDEALYDLANVFMLATPFGRPRVMSSFYFEDAAQGPPTDNNGEILRVHPDEVDEGSDEIDGCDGSNWVCEHRRPAIKGMVSFRRATASSTETTDFWSEGEDRIAFGRSGLGFVAINRSDEPLSERLMTGLPAGVYCDVLSVDLNCEDLTSQITVDDTGAAEVNVSAVSAVAIHINSRPL